MKTFLVPTDFSENAYNAAVYASHLAAFTNATVVLLNCYQLPSRQTNIMIDLKDLLEKDSVIGMEEVLTQLISDPETKGVNFITENYYGFLPEGIEEMSNKYNADLIVMGTMGASNIGKKIFGSNTSQLIKNTKTPLLVVPAAAKWNGLQKITVATDYSAETTLHLFQSLFDLFKILKLQIDVLHIIDDENKQNNNANQESIIEKTAKQNKVVFHYHPAENVTDGILNYVSKNDCDLLVMLRKKYNFFEGLLHTSATRKLALHATKPLLLFQLKS